MAKVTSKLQVTVPKALADHYGIRAGDEIEWTAAGDVIRVIPPHSRQTAADVKTRLKLFDQATLRLRARRSAVRAKRGSSRGWRREDLYRRGRPD